jgi:hypothetical protein
LGTDEGLIRFSKAGAQVTRYTQEDGLLGGDVQAVRVYNGEVWIGTSDGGLSKFDGEKFTAYGKDEGLFDPRVMALDVNEDYVWLGLTQGLSRFDKRAETFQNWELPGGFGPEVGSGSGEGARGERRVYCDSILIDGKYIWHGAYNAFRSDQNLTESKEIGCNVLPNSRITAICKDEDKIYIGTVDGFVVLDKETLEFERFRKKLLEGSVLALASDGKYLWVGTEVGVTRFNKESCEFTGFGYREGFRGGLIFSLAVDESYVWIGTINGLFRLDKSAEPVESPILDDFESGRIGGLWDFRGPEANCKLFIDSETGANGTDSSLCLELRVPEKVSPIDMYVCSIVRRLREDVTRYEGITFLVKAETRYERTTEEYTEVFEFNLYENEDEERWVYHPPHLPPSEWTRVTLPFSSLRVCGPFIANRILELHKVNVIDFAVLEKKCHPGQVIKLWLDEIRLYKKGEFEPTVFRSRNAH